MTSWAEPPTLREWLWVKVIAPTVFMLVVVPVFLTTVVVLTLVYDLEAAMDTIDRWTCRLTSHQWADEDEYGVEPVCAVCGAERDGEKL